MKFLQSFKLELIYVFRINDTSHLGCLKVGKASSENISKLEPNNSKNLNLAAKERIKSYTQTAGIKFELLHTEVATWNDGEIKTTSVDNDVREVLKRSGIKKKVFDTENKANEWVITDLETVKNAIKAKKHGFDSLNSNQISETQNPIIFRTEQKDAIERARKQFKKGNEMLWFAKMRFGKTLSALQVAKEHNFKRTLILTHRPIVDFGWFEDFNKIFNEKESNFLYGSKKKGNSYKTLEKELNNNNVNYIYFASIQDLRGSELVGGTFNKNDAIFQTDWNYIIVDEAHEGTRTQLGVNVLNELRKLNTKILQLSGTPFNIFDDYEEEEIFTWDYVMEQKAKSEWDRIHFGDPNPYASLPRMNIYTYDLGSILNDFIDEDVAFNFREFFRINENEEFIYINEINKFLNLLCKVDSDSNYPFATEEYRKNFRHSLWMLPGVKEAKALSIILKKHSVFNNFNIVNVAGDGDEEEIKENALDKVQKAITNKPHETFSITLSCGRLTTGVSVKAWTAVFMLSGSHNSSASSYMQTIFRVQTPATINGKIKEECFVFDFAPDRTLKVIAETAKISAKAGKTSGQERKLLGEFLNFCPIISADGSQMKIYNVNGLLEQLKKVYIERVVNNGFEDGHLYDNEELMKLDSLALEEFNSLNKIIGKTKAIPKIRDIDINKQGFTDEEYERLEVAKKKKKKELSDEDKRLLEERKEKKKNRDTAISILRSISIRMPLLIYGADIRDEDNEISIDNFVDLVDNSSWKEFMPNKVTKETFKKFKKYYEPDVFRAAGKRIRAVTRAADKLTIEDRIERITGLFSKFKNPDKETVLTPWRVVNMHMSDCLGGYTFYDNNFENTISEPRCVNQENQNVFNPDSYVLELNSKSGLYPLFITYSIYRNKIEEKYDNIKHYELSISEQLKIWDEVITQNLFVICQTPMAKFITKRTLVGFRNANVNTRYFDNLILQITHKQQNFIEKIKKGKDFWKTNNNNNMKFNAIVGNPPYQIMDGGHSGSAKPVYHHFIEIAKKLKPNLISMIMPARWYAGGKGLDNFRDEMLNDSRVSEIYDFPNSNECFSSVDIAGGVCYIKWNSNHKNECSVTSKINGNINSTLRNLSEFDILIRDNKAVPIIKKVIEFNKRGKNLSERVSSRKPFTLPTNYKPSQKGVPCWFIQKIGLKFAKKEDVVDTNNYLDKWKFLVPKSPIAGQTDFTKPIGFYYDGNTIIAKPGQCCTESYIIAGAFDSEEETLSFKSYLFTKVVRFLLLQRVVSQDVTKKVFGFIPDLENYEGSYSDIDLCKLWNITNDEFSHIDSRIKTLV